MQSRGSSVGESKANPVPQHPAAYYNTTEATAAAIYDELWRPDGLATSLCFNTSKLEGTEAIYAWDTQQEVPADRTWVLDLFC